MRDVTGEDLYKSLSNMYVSMQLCAGQTLERALKAEARCVLLREFVEQSMDLLKLPNWREKLLPEVADALGYESETDGVK